MVTIFQSSIMTNFLYPLVLMFVLVYAILEKLNLFGSEGSKKQIHAILALTISLIFVAAVFPKIVVANLVQFLAVSLTILFVSLMLWGFVSGKGEFPEKMKMPLGIMIGIAVFFAVIWATGLEKGFGLLIRNFFSFLFNSSWSSSFWSTVLFLGVMAIVVAIVVWNNDKKK